LQARAVGPLTAGAAEEQRRQGVVFAHRLKHSGEKALGLLNFTDLLLSASRLVRDDLQVREALQHKYRFLFVDEFQDTDPMILIDGG
jgi:superfamily I DNA/RNA helicase